jgi:FKBP-type peptidyl-prolyl cis-trans isomerase FkpA
MTRRHLLHSFAALSLVATVACSGSDSPSPTAPSTGSAPFSTTDLRAGTGATAAVGQAISVNYTGWLYSNTAAENKGTQFDTSAGRGVYRFTLGAGSVIRGWDQGIPGMRVGGLRRIVIPPELAYGSGGSGPIPPNATLLFEVELVSIP